MKKTMIKHRISHLGATRLARVAATAAKFSLIGAISVGLIACGGSKKAPAVETEAADITRPPQTIVGRKEVQETSPDETISFDEWRKRRLQEQQELENPK